MTEGGAIMSTGGLSHTPYHPPKSVRILSAKSTPLMVSDAPSLCTCMPEAPRHPGLTAVGLYAPYPRNVQSLQQYACTLPAIRFVSLQNRPKSRTSQQRIPLGVRPDTVLRHYHYSSRIVWPFPWAMFLLERVIVDPALLRSFWDCVQESWLFFRRPLTEVDQIASSLGEFVRRSAACNFRSVDPLSNGLRAPRGQLRPKGILRHFPKHYFL